MLGQARAEVAVRSVRRKNRVDAKDVSATVGVRVAASFITVSATGLIDVAIGRIDRSQATVRRTGILNHAALNAIVARGGARHGFNDREGVGGSVGHRRHGVRTYAFEVDGVAR